MEILPIFLHYDTPLNVKRYNFCFDIHSKIVMYFFFLINNIDLLLELRHFRRSIYIFVEVATDLQ